MSTSPAKDIAAILALDGVATEATDLFVDEIPETPDFCVVVRNTTGFDANPAYRRDSPTVQVIIRGNKLSSEAAYDKALEVKNALLGRPTTTVNSKDYVQFLMTGDIIRVGQDENSRPLYSTNWRLVIESTSGGHRDNL